jgi:hypothetical protein
MLMGMSKNIGLFIEKPLVLFRCSGRTLSEFCGYKDAGAAGMLASPGDLCCYDALRTADQIVLDAGIQ